MSLPSPHLMSPGCPACHRRSPACLNCVLLGCWVPCTARGAGEPTAVPCARDAAFPGGRRAARDAGRSPEFTPDSRTRRHAPGREPTCRGRPVFKGHDPGTELRAGQSRSLRSSGRRQRPGHAIVRPNGRDPQTPRRFPAVSGQRHTDAEALGPTTAPQTRAHIGVTVVSPGHPRRRGRQNQTWHEERSTSPSACLPRSLPSVVCVHPSVCPYPLPVRLSRVCLSLPTSILYLPPTYPSSVSTRSSVHTHVHRLPSSVCTSTRCLRSSSLPSVRLISLHLPVTVPVRGHVGTDAFAEGVIPPPGDTRRGPDTVLAVTARAVRTPPSTLHCTGRPASRAPGPGRRPRCP